MSRLEGLYQEMILEHNKNPRNFRVVEGHTHTSHGLNPLCGDDYYVYLRVKDNVLEELGFTGSGCAISKSSGSLMTSSLTGRSIEDAIKLKNLFLSLVTKDNLDGDKADLGKLKVFEGVKKFPARVKCAALVWRALEDALEGQRSGVTTE